LKILVTGACGYVGSLLVPRLLADGHKVVGYDQQFFGDAYLPKDNDSLTMVKADIRDITSFRWALKGCDAVIHLACLSNDYCCQLDEALSTEINYNAFEPLVMTAKHEGVKRFIYCSSSSVYGVSDAPDITEEHPLVPLTLYNKYKGMCEPLLWKHQAPDFTCVTIRPATVCGYAPRMRFDLTVNVMTLHAVKRGMISVFGGKQRRPNLHIKDMVDTYRLMLAAPAHKIAGQTFNVGKQNMTVMEIAQLIQKTLPTVGFPQPSITVEESQDNRSYHVNSDKIARVLGFVPRYSVEDAIRDMCIKFESGHWKDGLTNPLYTNVKQYVEAHGMGKNAA